ncbi:MAG: hypothetical protein HYU64_04605 [Armatimonadetes bacterium]|nr:hypothetical protein [Armatimonadota bacterium]
MRFAKIFFGLLMCCFLALGRAEARTETYRFSLSGMSQTSFKVMIQNIGRVLVRAQWTGDSQVEVTLTPPASRGVQRSGRSPLELVADVTPEHIGRSNYWDLTVRNQGRTQAAGVAYVTFPDGVYTRPPAEAPKPNLAPDGRLVVNPGKKEISLRVRNSGKAPCPSTIEVRFSRDGQEVALASVPGPSAGSFTDVVGKLPDLKGGKYMAEIDPKNKIPESDERDNWASLDFTAPLADLAPLSVKLISPGVVEALVKNEGTVASGPFQVQLMLKDKQLQTLKETVSSLAPNETRTITFSGLKYASGKHSANLQMDPEGKVQEKTKDNNAAVLNFEATLNDATVKLGADLAITGVAMPQQLVYGNAVEVQVTNVGDTPTKTSADVFCISEAMWGSKQVPAFKVPKGLEPGKTSTWVVKLDEASGTHPVKFRVFITDTNLANNEMEKTLSFATMPSYKGSKLKLDIALVSPSLLIDAGEEGIKKGFLEFAIRNTGQVETPFTGANVTIEMTTGPFSGWKKSIPLSPLKQGEEKSFSYELGSTTQTTSKPHFTLVVTPGFSDADSSNNQKTTLISWSKLSKGDMPKLVFKPESQGLTVNSKNELVFTVANPNQDMAAEQCKFSVAVRDKNSKVVFEKATDLGFLAPKQEKSFTTAALSPGAYLVDCTLSWSWGAGYGKTMFPFGFEKLVEVGGNAPPPEVPKVSLKTPTLDSENRLVFVVRNQSEAAKVKASLAYIYEGIPDGDHKVDLGILDAGDEKIHKSEPLNKSKSGIEGKMHKYKVTYWLTWISYSPTDMGQYLKQAQQNKQTMEVEVP